MLPPVTHRFGSAPVLLLLDIAAEVLSSICIHPDTVDSMPTRVIPLKGGESSGAVVQNTQPRGERTKAREASSTAPLGTRSSPELEIHRVTGCPVHDLPPQIAFLEGADAAAAGARS